MQSHDIIDRVLDSDVFIPLMIVCGIAVTVLIRTIGSTIRSVARERTRREIAAYIAEGSMTPEQGERLMKAGNS